MNTLPKPRGELSARLLSELTQAVHELDTIEPPPTSDVFAHDDLQLALYLCYELHYRGLPGVDERWEWEASLLKLRAKLEARFERGLLGAVPFTGQSVPPGEVDLALRAIAERDAPPLSAYVRSKATLDQVRELLVHRSAYQLKEADPHSWAIPRLSGPPKAALIEIQADEYGGGRPEWIHAELFGQAMQALGLDRSYGAYLDSIPGVTLATVNLMSLFGLHRRWLGAIVGHLALFEMTSSIPNRRYGDGLRRLGLGRDATLFFDEHVVADAVHENVGAVDLAGGLARQNHDLCASILWGAQVLAHVDARWSGHVLGCWREGRTSLRSRGAKARELVRAVAERPDPGLAAPAQRHRAALAFDCPAVGVEQLEATANQQGAVAVGGDQDRILGKSTGKHLGKHDRRSRPTPPAGGWAAHHRGS